MKTIEQKAIEYAKKCDLLNQMLEKQADIRQGYLAGAKAALENVEKKQYKKGEYCKSINCPAYEDLMAGAKSLCVISCSAYRFHKYLDDHDYEIVKKETEDK